jgi:hypothetical protein
MSNKRMMSKQQRLYYEQNNKAKVQKELEEMAKTSFEIERKTTISSTFNPHKNSYYN